MLGSSQFYGDSDLGKLVHKFEEISDGIVAIFQTLHVSENAQDYQRQNDRQKAEAKGSEVRQHFVSCQEPSVLGKPSHCSVAHTKTHPPSCNELGSVNQRNIIKLIPKLLYKGSENGIEGQHFFM